MEYGERSLGDTPTWAVATVISIIVAFGFFFQVSLKRFGKWLDETKRKSLLAALDKIKQELMLFGLLSLIMGHWIVFVAKICIKSSVLSTRFYPCASKDDNLSVKRLRSLSEYSNNSFPVGKMVAGRHDYCPEGQESFASYESLEQLHRFIFVLGVTHVSYSFIAIALAMIKIYSWRRWESEANSLAIQTLPDTPEATGDGTKLRRLSTFIFHHASHPWSQHKVFVWLLCFSRQFWSSINRVDYMALRLGFITTHQLPLLYNFHNYMLRSMEEEFRDIVGISVPLWIYAIACIFLNFHGSNTYFWLSFLPVILVLLMGTKLHRVVVKLAVEIMDSCPINGFHRFNLRDELFWFGKPKLLLWLIQLISFQNAFEMATFLWSLWEIQEPSCFMDNQTYVVIRLVFGIISQIWCSFVTFPLYVIITQMGSRFKKSIVSENVRKSLHGWKRRVKKARQSSSSTIPLLGTTSLSVSNSDIDDTHHQIDNLPLNKVEEDDTINSRLSSFTNRQTSSSISHRDSEAFEPSLNDDQDYSSSEEEEQLTLPVQEDIMAV